MENLWIDFKALRAKLDFEQVLRHYGVEVHRKGRQHQGLCPLPGHDGKKNLPSFSANLERGIFHCFGCKAKGNVLEFAALMERVSLKNGAAIRKVALKLQEQFCPELSDHAKEPAQKPAPPPEQNDDGRVAVNAPLDFELKGLDATHPYLFGRGFSVETIRHFGLGFCNRGMLKNRIAIPLHDKDGQLIGYAGRVVDDAIVNEDNPRYRFPGTRERNGIIHEFRKSLFLYNGFRIPEPVDRLIVVESFTAVWWLHQHGYLHAVATMGVDCSPEQAALIVSLVKSAGHAWLWTDGAATRHAQSVLMQVSPHRLVRWAKLADGRQLTDLAGEDLEKGLSL